MKDYSKTRFKQKIRISVKNLEYIREIKANYTLAGKLDEIINFYKHATKQKPK